MSQSPPAHHPTKSLIKNPRILFMQEYFFKKTPHIGGKTKAPSVKVKCHSDQPNS